MKYFIPALLLFCTTLSAGDTPIIRGDPWGWTPPRTRPAHPPLPRESPELKARFEIALREADDVEKEQQSWPKGAQICMVKDGGQAKAAGLKIGDIITKIDETAVTEDDINQYRKDAPQKMTLWRYGKGFWVIDVQPGKIGTVTYVPNEHEKRDFGKFVANPKWDAHIATFKKLYFANPEFAEISLRRAIAAGLPQDIRTDGWFAELALNQLNFARAMDFAWLACPKGAPSEEVGCSFTSAAIASGKYPAALEMASRMTTWSKKLKEPLEKLVAEMKPLPKAQHALSSPLKQAEAFYKDDMITRLEYVSGSQNKTDSLRKSRELFFTIPINCYWKMAVKPDAQNLLFRQKFIIRAHQGGPYVYPNCYQLDFRPVGGMNPDGGAGAQFVFRVTLMPPNLKIETGAGLYYAVEDRKLFQYADQVHDITVAIVGERAEVLVDGRNYGEFYLGRGNVPLVPAYLSVGTDSATRDNEMYELLDENTYRERVKQDNGVTKSYADNLTRLHTAAACGLTREAGILIELGADANAHDANEQTPLHHAVRFNQPETAKLLLSKGATLDLHAAAGLGDLENVKKLLSTPGDPKKSPQNWTPLHGAAVSGNAEVIKALLENKAVVDAKTPGREATPLMWAARYGQKDAVNALIAAGANRSQIDNQKRAPADYARWGRFDDLSRFIDTGNAAAPAIRPPRPPEEF